MISRTGQLRRILEEDRVIPVFGPSTALDAKLMGMRYPEAIGFCGTGVTLGNYTGMPDTGVATMTEQVAAARYMAHAVSYPLMMDGDTGHGGPPAVQRLVEECIDAGIAGLRLDDQPLVTKNATLSGRIEVVGINEAIERYAAARAKRDEIDPDFVLIAQCYAREARNGGLDDCFERLQRYASEGGVDWVQMTGPESLDEVKAARNAVPGFLSVMQGKLPHPLSLDEHRAIGLDAAWYTFFPDPYRKSQLLDAMDGFKSRGVAWWTDYCEEHADNPFTQRSMRFTLFDKPS